MSKNKMTADKLKACRKAIHDIANESQVLAMAGLDQTLVDDLKAWQRKVTLELDSLESPPATGLGGRLIIDGFGDNEAVLSAIEKKL